MGVGVWDPNAGSASDKQVDSELLTHLLVVASIAGEQVTSDLLQSHELETSQWLVALEPGGWDAAADLSSAELDSLIRFFTLVEDQISGWEAGNKSPVIPMVKILKDRGEFDAELRKWIKSHTENRYLPYGSAL